MSMAGYCVYCIRLRLRLMVSEAMNIQTVVVNETNRI
jgi:hypothetical protein